MPTDGSGVHPQQPRYLGNGESLELSQHDDGPTARLEGGQRRLHRGASDGLGFGTGGLGMNEVVDHFWSAAHRQAPISIPAQIHHYPNQPGFRLIVLGRKGPGSPGRPQKSLLDQVLGFLGVGAQTSGEAIEPLMVAVEKITDSLARHRRACRSQGRDRSGEDFAHYTLQDARALTYVGDEIPSEPAESRGVFATGFDPHEHQIGDR